tara:strand:- start:788 stop:991 length:204 start_codon:yes stop_codon:yes gene_type:complete
MDERVARFFLNSLRLELTLYFVTRAHQFYYPASSLPIRYSPYVKLRIPAEPIGDHSYMMVWFPSISG